MGINKGALVSYLAGLAVLGSGLAVVASAAAEPVPMVTCSGVSVPRLSLAEAWDIQEPCRAGVTCLFRPDGGEVSACTPGPAQPALPSTASAETPKAPRPNAGVGALDV